MVIAIMGILVVYTRLKKKVNWKSSYKKHLYNVQLVWKLGEYTLHTKNILAVAYKKKLLITKRLANSKILQYKKLQQSALLLKQI